MARQKKKKSKGDGPKIIIPGNCAESSKPILEPMCKNAIVLGGSDGFGFAAADHLLLKGARVGVFCNINYLILEWFNYNYLYKKNYMVKLWMNLNYVELI